MRRMEETDGGFRHEAFLYAGDHEFLSGAVSFLEDALAAEQPTLVVVSAPKIELLRSALGADADAVCFADMADVGRNPARIIPAWRDFVVDHAAKGTPLRGIGEPIWSDRTADELDECHRHEALLNLAFAGSPSWWLLCPYDTEALDRSVIHEAHRTHPYVRHGAVQRPSAAYGGLEMSTSLMGSPLDDPPVHAPAITFDGAPLDTVRQFVSRHVATAGLDPARTADLVFAVNEVATNSLRHGGGRGMLRVWHHDEAVICEVRDDGRIHDPLTGRQRPSMEQENGRGLWLVNQLCDLVQVRSHPEGTVVRMHMTRR